MKTIAKATALFLSIAFILSSCGKYEDGPGLSLKSKMKRLQREWQLEELEVDGTDYTADINQWLVEFKDDGKLEESIQVEGYETFNRNGEWDFSNDKTEVEITYDNGEKKDIDLSRLTAKELWFEFTETYQDGSSERYKCKFEAK